MRVCNRHRSIEAAGTVRLLGNGSEVDLCKGCLEEYEGWAAKRLDTAEAAPIRRKTRGPGKKNAG